MPENISCRQVSWEGAVSLCRAFLTEGERVTVSLEGVKGVMRSFMGGLAPAPWADGTASFDPWRWMSLRVEGWSKGGVAPDKIHFPPMDAHRAGSLPRQYAETRPTGGRSRLDRVLRNLAGGTSQEQAGESRRNSTDAGGRCPPDFEDTKVASSISWESLPEHRFQASGTLSGNTFRNRYSVNGFSLGPEPVCRLSLDREFFSGKRASGTLSLEAGGWVELEGGAGGWMKNMDQFEFSPVRIQASTSF